MGNRILRAIAVFTLLLLLAACRSSAPTQDTRLSFDLLSIIPETLMVGATEITLRVTREGAPLANAAVAITGDMTHAGMEPVSASAQTDADGIVRIPMAWTMSGDWVVRVSVTAPDGGLRTGEFPLIINDAVPPGS